MTVETFLKATNRTYDFGNNETLEELTQTVAGKLLFPINAYFSGQQNRSVTFSNDTSWLREIFTSIKSLHQIKTLAEKHECLESLENDRFIGPTLEKLKGNTIDTSDMGKAIGIALHLKDEAAQYIQETNPNKEPPRKEPPEDFIFEF